MSLTPEEEGQRLTMKVTQPPLRTGSLVQTHGPPRSPSEASGVTAAAGAEPCTVPTARRTQKDPNAFCLLSCGWDRTPSRAGGAATGSEGARLLWASSGHVSGVAVLWPS